jgi:hypothetical protein
VAISSLHKYYEAAMDLSVDMLAAPYGNTYPWKRLVQRYSAIEKLHAEAAKELKGRDVTELQELERSFVHFIDYFGGRSKESITIAAKRLSLKEHYTSDDKNQDMIAIKKLEQMLKAPEGSHSLQALAKVYVTMTAKTQRQGYILLCEIFGRGAYSVEKDGMIHFAKNRRALLSPMVYQDRSGRIIDHLKNIVDSKYDSVIKDDFSAALTFLSKAGVQLLSPANADEETSKHITDKFIQTMSKVVVVFLDNFVEGLASLASLDYTLGEAARENLQQAIEIYIEKRLSDLESSLKDSLTNATPKRIQEVIDNYLKSQFHLKRSDRAEILKVCTQILSFIIENQETVEYHRETFKQLIGECLANQFLDFLKSGTTYSYDEHVENYLRASLSKFHASIDENSTPEEIEGHIRNLLALTFSPVKNA